MNNNCLVILSLALSAVLAGCSQQNAQFVDDDGVTRLEEKSPASAEDIRTSLTAHFGTPNALVAFGSLPLDFGSITGKVISTENSDTLRVALDQPSAGNLAASAAVLTTAVSDKPVQVIRSVLSYNAASRTLTLQPAANAPTSLPDSPIELVGHRLQSGRQLYMQHCMHCHGVTGDGHGPTARYIRNHRFNPLPRDYRRGEFKFKSTKGTIKASRRDLAKSIKYGIPGTYMPSFRLLEDAHLSAIVEYVRFLAMRGEFERALLDYFKAVESPSDNTLEALDATFPKDEVPDEQQRQQFVLLEDFFDELKELTGEDKLARAEKLLAEQLAARISEALEDIAGNWTDAEVPQNLVVPTVARVKDSPESRRRGFNLFQGTATKCTQCHGEGGRGNGFFVTTIQEDPITKEKSDRPGIFDIWGNEVRPRDLTSGIYRGGRRPLDIFHRLSIGIGPSKMSSFANLKEIERWDVVNYVLSIPIDGAFFDEHGHQYHGGDRSLSLIHI